jgi:hypothetical protein
MANGTLAGDFAQAVHYVMAGNAAWFINNEKTVHPTTLDDPPQFHSEALPL